MGKKFMNRKKLGLSFKYNYKSWSGGVIYVLNIISALKFLNDSDKPEIFLYYCKDSPINDVKVIEYPYIRYILMKDKYTFTERVINYGFKFLFRNSIFLGELPDIVYPDISFVRNGRKVIHWIPDFQERYLPQFFSNKQINDRIIGQNKISQNENALVLFSSADSKNDFVKFYPHYKCNLEVLSFACTLPAFEYIDINFLKDKYNITKPYFIAPNQFWQHKNHIIILEAIKNLKDKNLDFQVIFTGSENDYRNIDYFERLKNTIKEYDIQKWVKFLGFIDRAEQLKLMDEALAIIQPSLFEGWSTVVEDAKALSQFILLSNLNVHIEQIDTNCHFFDPFSSQDLSNKMLDVLVNRPVRVSINYELNKISFANKLLSLLLNS